MYTKEMKDLVVKEYQEMEHAGLREDARKLGMAYTTMCGILKEYGITPIKAPKGRKLGSKNGVHTEFKMETPVTDKLKPKPIQTSPQMQIFRELADNIKARLNRP